MKDLILSGKVSEDTINDWMLTISFIPNPDHSMMESVLTILKGKPFSANIALSVAALTHTFCNLHSNCETKKAVYYIIDHFEQTLDELLREDVTHRVIEDKVNGDCNFTLWWLISKWILLNECDRAIGILLLINYRAVRQFDLQFVYWIGRCRFVRLVWFLQHLKVLMIKSFVGVLETRGEKRRW